MRPLKVYSLHVFLSLMCFVPVETLLAGQRMITAYLGGHGSLDNVYASLKLIYPSDA